MNQLISLAYKIGIRNRRNAQEVGLIEGIGMKLITKVIANDIFVHQLSFGTVFGKTQVKAPCSCIF